MSSPSPSPSGGRIPARVDPVALGVAMAAVLLYFASELFIFSGRLGLPLDDSWIHLHFARSLSVGEGSSFNPGQWVGGSTAPLWTALLSLAFVLPGSPLFWAKLMGALFFLLSVDATGRLGRELGLGTGLSRLAAVLVATTHWLLWSALSAMEVGLFTTLSLWGLILHLRERAVPGRLPVSMAVLGAACLARPEGLVLLAAVVLDRGLALVMDDQRRPKVRGLLEGLAIAALALLPTLLAYGVLGDSFLPTTFHAKAGGDPDFWPSGRYLRAVLDVLFRSQPLMLVFAGGGALVLAERFATPRGRGLSPIFWVFGLPFAASLVATDAGPVVVGNFGRYFFPLLPVVTLLGVLALERVAGRLAGRRWISAVFVIAVLSPQFFGMAEGAPLYVRTIANVEDSDVAAARWLEERISPGALIAAQDVGAIKYQLPNPVLDLAGIVNPEILPVLRGSGPDDAAAWQERLYDYLAERRPAYLVVFPRFYPDLVRRPGFRPLEVFEVRDNVTMAGNELVIFATPWTATEP